MLGERVYITPNEKGVALIGAHFHELNDESSSTYSTESLGDFSSMLKGVEASVFISQGSSDVDLYAYKNEDLKEVRFNTQPYAKSSLIYHPVLRSLLVLNNKSDEIRNIVNEIKKVKRYLKGGITENGDLLSRLDKIRVLKEMEFVDLQDKKGNIELSVTVRDKAGAEKEASHVLPEYFSFEAPLFEFLPDKVEIVFDVEIQPVLNARSVKMVLVNHELNHWLRGEVKKVLEQFLRKENENIKLHYGSLKINRNLDDWKYKPNYVEKL